MDAQIEPNAILDFWFAGAENGDSEALDAAFARWFQGGQKFDDEIRQRFASLIDSAIGGGLQDWETNVRARLALIILLDQFPRQVYRRTSRAFAGDARALVLARLTVRSGEHRELSVIERVFLLMPYQHAESKAAQAESVALFTALANEPAPPAVKGLLNSSLDYAIKHREIIERFGRFPYRNEALGRASTSEELDWLDKSGLRFGQ